MTTSVIHVFGDSHTGLFTSITGCQVHHLGPKTMFGIRKVDAINGKPFLVTDYGVKEGEYVVYVFGEIDVRTHIGRIRDILNKPLDFILQDLVDKYLQVVLRNQGQSKSKSIIASVVPPSSLIVNPEYPFYGSLEERVAIQQELNKKLEVACKEHGILFLNYAHYYANTNGSLNHTYSDGHVHVRPDCSRQCKEELYKLVHITTTEEEYEIIFAPVR